jgi:hypothetical protein
MTLLVVDAGAGSDGDSSVEGDFLLFLLRVDGWTASAREEMTGSATGSQDLVRWAIGSGTPESLPDITKSSRQLVIEV